MFTCVNGRFVYVCVYVHTCMFMWGQRREGEEVYKAMESERMKELELVREYL